MLQLKSKSKNFARVELTHFGSEALDKRTVQDQNTHGLSLG